MHYIGELTTDGYGMAIIPIDLLMGYLASKKCRAKKLLSYLQKNFELFLELVEKGKLVPFYRINSFEYHIFASINEEAVIPEGFKEVCRFEKFYLEVGDLMIWIMILKISKKILQITRNILKPVRKKLWSRIIIV